VSGQQPDPLAFELIRPGASAPDESGRRRTHPLTPFIHGVRWWPAAVALAVSMSVQFRVTIGTGALLIAGAALVVLTLLGTGVAYLSWQRLTFWFDADGDLRVDSGVLSRQQRRLQLSRLQSVDVLQPLLARLAGLAEVRVEVAGAGDSKVTLQFLTLAEASALRNEIVARSAGVRHDAEEAPETLLASVPPGDLVLSLLLRAETFLLLAVTVLLVAITILTEGTLGILLLVTGGVPLFSVFAQFSRYYEFTVAESPDGLRLRHGLLQKTRQTVPPGRVQAVGFVQPFLWRKRGWVRVRLNVAGVSTSAQGSGDQSYTENVLLPVAPWPVALEIVRRVLPGVDIMAIPLVPAPERAKRRAWIQWRQLAVGWTDDVFITRGGRITERWDVVPHARTQSVRVTQGPWERSLGLASMHVDSTPGAVKIVGLHRDAAEAWTLAQQQADRAAHARGSDRSLRWVAQQHLAAAASPLVGPSAVEPATVDQSPVTPSAAEPPPVEPSPVDADPAKTAEP
jgi:putative membrane protein